MSISDWIAIASIISQVVTALVVVKLSTRTNKRVAKQPAENQTQPLAISNAKWFFDKAWGFLLGVPMSIFWLWVNIASPEPPTRGFVALLLLLSLWLIFNLLGLLVCVAVASVRKT